MSATLIVSLLVITHVGDLAEIAAEVFNLLWQAPDEGSVSHGLCAWHSSAADCLQKRSYCAPRQGQETCHAPRPYHAHLERQRR